eukprot:Skav207197  [mRNA]  locus=scaffold4046:163864:173886:- [translate_table: standard]
MLTFLMVTDDSSGKSIDTKQPRALRNRSFASIYGNLQRVAHEQQPPGFCRRDTAGWGAHSYGPNLTEAIFLGVISGSSAIMAIMDTFVVLPILNLHTTLALLIGVFSLNLFSTLAQGGMRFEDLKDEDLRHRPPRVLARARKRFERRGLLCSQGGAEIPELRGDVTAAASGLGYMISTTFPPKHGPFITAIVIFVSCGLLGHPLRVETMADGKTLEFVRDRVGPSRTETVGYYYLNFLAMQLIAGIETIYESPGCLGAERRGAERRGAVVGIRGWDPALGCFDRAAGVELRHIELSQFGCH